MKKKRLFLIAWIGAVAIGITLTINPINFQTTNSQFHIMDSDGPRSAILDQLYNDHPDGNLEDISIKYFKDAGYQVDFYTTDELTVDFFRQLPSMNYDYIVIRSHALGEGTIGESSSIFTGQKYSKHIYIKEQFLGHLGRGIPILYAEDANLVGEARLNQTYFVVGSKFVEEYMVGQFQNSTIILAGCETADGSILADSLIKRGASEVIGWTGLVDSNDNALTLVSLLNKTLVNDIELKDAIQMEMEERKKFLKYPATLKYFSSESGL